MPVYPGALRIAGDTARTEVMKPPCAVWAGFDECVGDLY
jgi:hypothetical protein